MFSLSLSLVVYLAAKIVATSLLRRHKQYWYGCCSSVKQYTLMTVAHLFSREMEMPFRAQNRVRIVEVPIFSGFEVYIT